MKGKYLPNSSFMLVICVISALLATVASFTVMLVSAKLLPFKIYHILEFFLASS